jgi:hypothetical protein
MTRLNILPEPEFHGLQANLTERLARVGGGIGPEQFGALADPLIREVFHTGVADVRAHEGTIWLVDEAEEYLVPAINTGPQAAKFVGKFRQPLSSGLICMVFANEQPFLENEVPKSPKQSKLLDSLLQVQTTALIAVPFYFLNTCRGVISCVKLAGRESATGDANGFALESLASIQRTSAILTKLVEYQLLSAVVGCNIR